MVDKVTFVGSFPAIASAIKVSGNGDGMRIMIDVPENQMAEALKVMLFRQTAIQVTIEPYEQTKPETTTGEPTGGDGRRTLKRSTARR